MKPRQSKSPQGLATAFLVGRRDISARLVKQLLPTFYKDGGQMDFPSLISRSEALNWSPVAFHLASQAYFNPINRFGWLASVMESLAATKELLFALGAGLYLLWLRWRRILRRFDEKSWFLLCFGGEFNSRRLKGSLRLGCYWMQGGYRHFSVPSCR